MQTVFTVILNMAVAVFLMQLILLVLHFIPSRILPARVRYALWNLIPLAAIAAIWDMPLLAGAYLDLVSQLWGVILLVILMLQLFTLFRKYFLLRGSRKIESRIFEICLHDCKAERTAVKLARSNAVDTPITWGIFYKRILLSANIDTEDTSLMYHLCCHELIHAKRSDNLRKVIFRLLQGIFWFNPLMWICYPVYLRDMEDSCDEVTLRISEKIKKEEYLHMIALAQRPSEEKEEVQVHLLPHVTRYTPKRIKNIRSDDLQHRQPVLLTIFAVTIVVAAGIGGYFIRSPLLLVGSRISYNGQEGRNIARMDQFCESVREGKDDAIELVVKEDGTKTKYNLIFQNGILQCRIQESSNKPVLYSYSRITRTQQDGMVYYTLISDTQKRELLAAPDKSAQELIEQNLEMFEQKMNVVLSNKTGQINVTNLQTIYAGSLDNLIRVSSQAAYLYNYGVVQQNKVTMLKNNEIESTTASAGDLRLVQDAMEGTFGSLGTYRRDYDEEAAKYMFEDLFVLLKTAMQEQYLQNTNITLQSDQKVNNISFTFNETFEQQCARTLFGEEIPGIDNIRPEGTLHTSLEIKFDSQEKIRTITLRRYCGENENTMHLRTTIYDFSMVGQEVDLYKQVNLESFKQANILLEQIAELSPASIWAQGTVEGTSQTYFYSDSPEKNLQFSQLLSDLGLSIQGDGSVTEGTSILTVDLGEITLYLSRDQKQITVASEENQATFSTQIVAYRYICNWLVQNLQ